MWACNQNSCGCEVKFVKESGVARLLEDAKFNKL